jgi:two-component system repressor protein LuxO
VQRVGEDKARPCDARIVCASNRDPEAEVRAGRLREDLFYRLNGVALALPPLRERDDDVLLIARHVLGTVSAEEGRLFSGFTPEAERALLAYGWPGNVRELQNVIRSVVVLNTGPQVTPDMLPPEVLAAEPAGLVLPAETPPRAAAEGIRPLDDVIRATIEAAVVACGGNIPRAAAALGVAPSTIYRRLQGWRDEGRG